MASAYLARQHWPIMKKHWNMNQKFNAFKSIVIVDSMYPEFDGYTDNSLRLLFTYGPRMVRRGWQISSGILKTMLKRFSLNLTGFQIQIMLRGTVVSYDWYKTAEGQGLLAHLTDPNTGYRQTGTRLRLRYPRSDIEATICCLGLQSCLILFNQIKENSIA